MTKVTSDSSNKYVTDIIADIKTGQIEKVELKLALVSGKFLRIVNKF